MATTYNYDRDLSSNGIYKIPNTDRVDGGSDQIQLAKEIETALPGEAFVVCCNHLEVDIIFTNALSAGNKTILDGIVTDHKENNP